MIVILIIVIISNKSEKKQATETTANSQKQSEVCERTGLSHEQENKQNGLKKTENNQMKKPEEKPEIFGALKRENRRFMKAYLSMSEWEKNKTKGWRIQGHQKKNKPTGRNSNAEKKKHYELLKKFPNDQHHCIGFDLPTAAEAFEHFRGMLEELWDYGDMCNGHCLHTWDDGGRKLYRCRNCGGLILVQKSEYHGEENDDYYTDYFPVDSVQEAERLNELYGGWAIEKEWNGKKVFVSNGHVTPYFR
ncbi:MAG: hypothetical protein IJ620_06265 [Bacteroidales bacterium]|nr:hypothetical protein [Bacteroidales bacterium]